MTYDLYCVVNAIGVPYNDTFSTCGHENDYTTNPWTKSAWCLHYWRDIPKNGDHADSFLLETSEKHQAMLRARGDRVLNLSSLTSK